MLENIMNVINTVNNSYKAFTVGVVFKNGVFTWHENTSKVELVGNTLFIKSESNYEYPLQDVIGLTLVD